MSCECPNTSPNPSINCVPYSPDMSNPISVRMYLGENFVPDCCNNIDLFYAETEDFKVQYSYKDLVSGGVLPEAESGPESYFFELTERELLATASYETWITYVSAMAACEIDTFGSLVIELLGVDKTNWMNWAIPRLNTIHFDNTIVGQFSHFFRWVLSSDSPSIIQSERNLIESKLILCYQWLKQIYDNYYGKTYLVKIGQSLPQTHEQFNGVCIKDKNGNYPTIPKPFIVEGDGSAHGLYVSDEVVSDGGMQPNNGSSSLIGLNLSQDSELFRTDDGKLDCFVRFGTISISEQESDTNVIIHKFGREYIVDISKLSPENYIISDRNDSPYRYDKNLFIKANASNTIYVDHHGEWALVTLSQLVPLIPLQSRGNYRQATDFVLSFISEGLKTFYQKAINSVGNEGEFVADSNKSGALNNSSQLNLLIGNDLTVFPEAFAIPMKSNILRYGPYFASDDSSGGVDIVNEDFLAPWNFMTHFTSGVYQGNIATAYNDMNNAGNALASDSIKSNLSIETGKLTVAGLPQFSLAYQPQKPGGGLIGPHALLSDIAISYGSSGFTTTYNFSTFTPRFGQPGKYLIDRWSDSIKEIQATNRYLREERQKIRNISNTLKQTFSSKQIASGLSDRQLIDGPKGKTSSSPDKFLYSGYYLGTQREIYPSPSPSPILDINNGLPPCYPCAIEPQPSPLMDAPPPPPGSGVPGLPFAETHTGYTDEYIQDTYYQLSIMSLDGLFLPVSLKGTPKQSPSQSPGPNCLENEWDVLLPRYAKQPLSNGGYGEFEDMSLSHVGQPGYPSYNQTRHCMPPFALDDFGTIDGGNNINIMPITQQYLNPMLSSSLMANWDDRKTGSATGFKISSIAFGCKFTQFESTAADEGIRQGEDNFRFSALRGPLVLQGWGYDTNGKPIPNKYDTQYNAIRGEFKKTGLADQFMDEWISSPKTWPVGPVDLRFDRERGVWTCPAQNKIIVARLKESLKPFGSAEAELVNPSSDGLNFYENFDITDKIGRNVKESLSKASIKVYDFIGMNLCACDIIYAYFDDNRYIVLESSRKYSQETCQPCTTVTPSPSPCPCPSPSISPSISVSPSISPSISVSPSISPSVSPSISPSISIIPSISPSISIRPSLSPTPLISILPSPSISQSVAPSPSSCWCGLECLQSLQNYDPCRTQALIHKNGCLMWEDIVQCDPIQNAIEQEKEDECREIYESQTQ